MIHNPETKSTSGSAQEVHPYKIRASTQNWELKTSQSGQEVGRAERLIKPSSRAPSSREDTKKHKSWFFVADGSAPRVQNS